MIGGILVLHITVRVRIFAVKSHKIASFSPAPCLVSLGNIEKADRRGAVNERGILLDVLVVQRACSAPCSGSSWDVRCCSLVTGLERLEPAGQCGERGSASWTWVSVSLGSSAPFRKQNNCPALSVLQDFGVG